MARKNADGIEIGDEVVLRGEVVWVDDDFVPRVRIDGTEHPIRVASGSLQVVGKAKKPRPVKTHPVKE